MSTPTLGYEYDIEISKDELACIQLVEAIALFLQGNTICSITLAGAAEAILAGILEAEGTPSIVNDSVASIQAIRDTTSLKPMEGKAHKNIFNDWNSARNDLKHHGKSKAKVIKLNLFDEAYWMIKRALANADKAGITISNAQDFENWIILNINL